MDHTPSGLHPAKTDAEAVVPDLRASGSETGSGSGTQLGNRPTLVTPGLAFGVAAMLAACGGGSGPEHRLATESTQAPYLPLMGQARQGKRAPLAASAAAPLPSPDQLMNWAERSYAALFPGPQTTVTSGALVYRFYPKSGNYLGVLGQEVLALGPPTANQVVTVGTLAQFAEVVAAELRNDTASTDFEAARFLLQAQLSASEEEIAAVRQKGFALWLAEQHARPLPPLALDWAVSKGYLAIDTNEYFFGYYWADFAFWYQLMASAEAVRQRAALALSEFFVISLNEGTSAWRGVAAVNYWDMLIRNAFGNYRILLEEVSMSLSMGAFLSTRGNQKEDPATGRMPDENYAREVMQLFSIGVNELNLDGTAKTGSDGQALESYTQADVTNLARVFTGYDEDKSVGKFNSPSPPFQSVFNSEMAKRPMVFNPQHHSPLEKKFLGVTIPAGTPGPESLRIALDTLANHPNVGPFLGRQMIQRLVTSNPSPAYVARVAGAFNANPQGVRGDLGYMFRTILLDEEARGSAGLSSLTFGKLREPIVRIAQWARTFKVRSIRGTWKVQSTTKPWDVTRSLEQSPLRAPSVFNFFRPGYVPPSTALAANRATAPEMQIVNETTNMAYINYLQDIVEHGIWVRAPELPNNADEKTPTDGHDVVPDYSAELRLAHDSTALVSRLNLLLCAGQLPTATQTFITSALLLNAPRIDGSESHKRIHVANAIMFVMCSPGYLVQK